jgi:hypothetical protein
MSTYGNTFVSNDRTHCPRTPTVYYVSCRRVSVVCLIGIESHLVHLVSVLDAKIVELDPRGHHGEISEPKVPDDHLTNFFFFRGRVVERNLILDPELLIYFKFEVFADNGHKRV